MDCHVILLQEVVMLLLKNQAKVDVINAEGNTPRGLARTPEIRNLIEGVYKRNTQILKANSLF